MQQRRLTSVPPMFGVVLVAASTSNVNAVSCIAKPNGQAPHGQHWFYRTDRVTHRQCWYLAPQNADAQKSATQLSNMRTPAPRHAQRSTAQVAHGASTAETDVPPSAAAALADAPKLPDVPPSFAPAPQASSRLADATGPVPAPATNDTEEPQSLVNAQTSQVATAAQAGDERPSSLIVVSNRARSNCRTKRAWRFRQNHYRGQRGRHQENLQGSRATNRACNARQRLGEIV